MPEITDADVPKIQDFDSHLSSLRTLYADFQNHWAHRTDALQTKASILSSENESLTKELKSLKEEVSEAISLSNIDSSFADRNLEKYAPDAVIPSLPKSPGAGTAERSENNGNGTHVSNAGRVMLERRYRELYKQTKLIGGVFGVLKAKIEESKERVRQWEKTLQQDRFEVSIRGQKFVFCKISSQDGSTEDSSRATARRNEVPSAVSEDKNAINTEESAGKPLSSITNVPRSYSTIGLPKELPANGSIDSHSLYPPASPRKDKVLLNSPKENQTTTSPSNTLFTGSTLVPEEETLPSSNVSNKGRHAHDSISEVKVKEERRSSSPLGRLVQVNDDGTIVDEKSGHVMDSSPTQSGPHYETLAQPEDDRNNTERNTTNPTLSSGQGKSVACTSKIKKQWLAPEEATSGESALDHPPTCAPSLLPTATNPSNDNIHTSANPLVPSRATRTAPQKRRIPCESRSVTKVNALADDGETYWRANKITKLSPDSESNDDGQNGENSKKNRLSDLLGGLHTPKPKPILVTPWSAPAQPTRPIGWLATSKDNIQHNDSEHATETPPTATPSTRLMPEKACATKRQFLPAKHDKPEHDQESKEQSATTHQNPENGETQSEDPCPVAQPKDEPFRVRPLHRLDLSHFRLNPARNQGLDHAFDEVVRRKALRKCLPGCTRPDCCGEGFRRMAELKAIVSAAGDEFFTLEDIDEEDARALEEYLGPDRKNILGNLTADQRKDMLLDARTRDLANRFGKHRYVHPRAKSPPGFWETDMPTTQEENERKKEAKKVEREKVAERYREAMHPGGIWQFADE